MGSRWGEEEKKTRGLVGLFISLIILGAFCGTFYVNYKSLEGRRQLEKKMQDVVRSGYEKSESDMIGEILEGSEELKVPLTEEQIKLTKSLDDNGNPVVDVWIHYEFKINLFVTEFPVSLPISEKVTIVVI
jgi:hypothetical protein